MELVTKLAQTALISDYDVNVINDLITALPKNGLYDNIHLLEKIFNKDITPGHYAVLGVLMGVECAARELCAMYEKNLSSCQRLN